MCKAEDNREIIQKPAQTFLPALKEAVRYWLLKR